MIAIVSVSPPAFIAIGLLVLIGFGLALDRLNENRGTMNRPSWEGIVSVLMAVYVTYQLFDLGYETAAWITVGVIVVIVYAYGYYKAQEYLWRSFVRNSPRHIRVSCNRHLKFAARYGALFWFAIPALRLVVRRAEKRGLKIRQTYKDIDKAMT